MIAQTNNLETWVLEICKIQQNAVNSNFTDNPLQYITIQEVAIFGFIFELSQGHWVDYDFLLKSAIDGDIFFLGDIEEIIDRLHLFYQIVLITFDEGKKIKPVSFKEYKQSYDRDLVVQYLARFFAQNK